MKIRTGFVSNSSSSSFIIYVCDQYPNVFELAKAMIPARAYKNDKQVIKKINESKLDKNTPVFFRSCNYDTSIVRRDDNFYVKTCNNHNWSWVIDSYAYNRTRKSEDVFNTLFNFKDEKLWFVEKDKIIKDVDIYYNEQFKNKEHFCLDCGTDLYEVNGIVCCPSCNTSIDDITFIQKWKDEFHELREKFAAKNITLNGIESNFKINNFIFKRKKGKIFVYEKSKKVKCNIKKSDDVITFFLSQKVKSIKKL